MGRDFRGPSAEFVASSANRNLEQGSGPQALAPPSWNRKKDRANKQLRKAQASGDLEASQTAQKRLQDPLPP